MKIRMYVFIFCIMSISLLAAQEIDWNITGAGARAAGFGGAFIGVADDATAIVWNPAGLTQLEKPEASIVSKLVSEETKIDNKGTLYSATLTQTHGALDFLSFASPLNKNKIVGALAWQQEIDGYYKQDTQERSGGINAISIGAAMPLGKLFSFGLTGNVWTGSMKSKNTDPEDLYNGTSKYSGFNFVVGGMADFSSSSKPLPLKLGLTIRTPFDLNEKTTATGETDSNYKLSMPLMVGIGTSYRFGDTFTLALDIENRQYSKSKLVNKDIDEESSKISEYDLNQLRLGGEYLLLFSNFRIPLRLGLQSVPTIYSNWESDLDTETSSRKDQVIGSGVAIGTGFITDRFSFDLTITGRAYEQKIGNYFKSQYSNSTMYLSGIVYFK